MTDDNNYEEKSDHTAFACRAQTTGRRKRSIEHGRGQGHWRRRESKKKSQHIDESQINGSKEPDQNTGDSEGRRKRNLDASARTSASASSSARSECTPRVASHSSTQDNTDYPAASVLAKNADNDATPHNFWLGAVGDHIIFDLGCNKLVNGVTLQNTRRGRDDNAGTKEFSIWMSDSATGTWRKITDGVMRSAIGSDPVQTEDFTYTAVVMQFIKFQIEDIYGTMGGLQFIAFKRPITTTTSTTTTTHTTSITTTIPTTTTTTTTTDTTTTTTLAPWMSPHETIREVTCVPWKWMDTTYWKWDVEIPEHCYSKSPFHISSLAQFA